MTAESLARWFVQGEVPGGVGAVTLVFERPLPAWAWLIVVVAHSPTPSSVSTTASS